MWGRLKIGAVLCLLLSGCQDHSTSPNANTDQSIRLVRISPQKANVIVGGTLQMSATGFTSSLSPAGEVEVTWTSSDTDVATVDPNGVVLGKKVGVVTISASNGTMKDDQIVGVVSASFGAKELTVSGKAFYEDKPFDQSGFRTSVPAPIRRAVVNLFAIDGFSVIGSGQTGEDGSYTFSKINNSNRRGGLYIQILTKTEDASLNPIKLFDNETSRNLMAIGGLPFDDTTSSSFNLPDLIAPASEIGGAFNIIDLFLQGGDFIQKTGSCPAPNTTCAMPPLIAYWAKGDPKEGTFYGTDGLSHEITLGGGMTVGGAVTGDPDEYDDTIILHEYGHFVASVFSRDDSPGGRHFISDNDQDIRLSWSEGWATFFASAVLGSPLVLDTNTKGISFDFEIENLSSIQTRSLPQKAIYTTSEVSVSGVLWDAFDSISPQDQDGDPMKKTGFLPIWNTFTKMSMGDRATMETFAVPFMSQNPAETPSFQTVLDGRRIALSPDAGETGLEPDLILNIAQHHTLYRPGSNPFSDVDTIPFSVDAKVKYTVKTSGLTNGADTFLTIIGLSSNDNVDGTIYAAGCTDSCPKNGQTTLASSITFTAGASGTLFAEVQRSPFAPPSTGLAGSYDIQFQVQP